MISLQTRSFLLGKDNEPDGRQDALAVNDTSAMYAVADGVSNSFHPEIIARLLCESFTALDTDTLSGWEEYADDILLPMVALRWGAEAENYLGQLSGRILRHERINYERWRMGASTFCGAYVDKERERLSYFIIGDSTLFAHCNDGRLLELNSSPKSTDENGEEKTDYSNLTSAVTSDATISGEWLVGELSLDGIDRIALMTDGMAKWYQNMCLRNFDPFEILWGIKDMNEFCTLANRVRSEEMEMDDDLAVILIRKVGVVAISKEKTGDGDACVSSNSTPLDNCNHEEQDKQPEEVENSEDSDNEPISEPVSEEMHIFIQESSAINNDDCKLSEQASAGNDVLEGEDESSGDEESPKEETSIAEDASLNKGDTDPKNGSTPADELVAEDESVNEVELTNKNESVNEEEVATKESVTVEESTTEDESAQDGESDEEEEHAEEENSVDDKEKGRIWDKIKNKMRRNKN